MVQNRILSVMILLFVLYFYAVDEPLLILEILIKHLLKFVLVLVLGLHELPKLLLQDRAKRSWVDN